MPYYVVYLNECACKDSIITFNIVAPVINDESAISLIK